MFLCFERCWLATSAKQEKGLRDGASDTISLLHVDVGWRAHGRQSAMAHAADLRSYVDLRQREKREREQEDEENNQ